MGAGTCVDHYMQDAGECYWVYLCQKELERLGINISSVEASEIEFNNYCSERGIVECFQVSDYKKNLDSCFTEFIKNIIKSHPDKKMDIKNVEAEYRNKGLKGDFIISFGDGFDDISISLKNYRNGYGSIQLKSGTWHSIINNFALNCAEGPGMYIDCENGLKFRAQSKSKVKRNKNYEKIGIAEIIPILDELDDILDEVKLKYIVSEETRIFNEEVSESWKKDCNEYGCRGIDLAIKALDYLPKEQIKSKLLKDTDLLHTEELLLIGPGGEMMCSLYNERYNDLLLRINNNCEINYIKHGKNLRFQLLDTQGEILHIDIPFTLQKNGAWYIPKDEYIGSIYHKKEKQNLVYGERRPKKSKELNTSTNMWFKIKEHL